MPSADHNDYLKIGDVAKLVGLSPTMIRMWERLGLTSPRRTESKYRLYGREDVQLLKRASFLRKVRGMNAPAIVQTLKREGALGAPADGSARAIGTRLRQLRLKMGASVATLRKLARYYQHNILDFYDTAEAHTRVVRPEMRKVLEAGNGVRMELLAWGN